MAESRAPFVAVLALLAACAFPLSAASPAAADPVADPPAPVEGATTGTTTRVTPADAANCCAQVEISADGRYVTYGMGLNNDLYQYDHVSGVTTRITAGDRSTLAFKASTDGRFIYFTSDATDLIDGQEGGERDVYLWDRSTGTTVSITGRTPNVASRFSYLEGLTPDGRYAVISSNEPLVPGGGDSISNIYLYDRVAQTTTAVTNGDGPSTGSLAVLDDNVDVLISPDGRYLTFGSWATDLVDTPSQGKNLYQWDRTTGTTTRLTDGGSGVNAIGASTDGRFVTFVGRVLSVVGPNPVGTDEIYQWDRSTGTTSVVATDSSQYAAKSVSADGDEVVYWDSNVLQVWTRSTATATTLAPAGMQAWAWTDDASLVVTSSALVWNAPTGPLELFDRAAGTSEPISQSKPEDWPTKVLISEDGETVTWTSRATDEVPGTSAGQRTPYQWDRATGDVIALAVPDQAVELRAQTADASRVVFLSAAQTLADDTAAGTNAFLWDRAATPTRPGAPRLGPETFPMDGAVTVSWAQVGNGSSAVTGFQVEVTPTSGSPITRAADAGDRTLTVDGLVNGTTYRARVRAQNANGWGPWSLMSSTLRPASLPGAPTQVTATPGDGRADVVWSPPANTGGIGVQSYHVQPLVDGEPVGFPTATNSGVTNARVTGLTNGTAYQFEVTAWNSLGAGPASDPSAAVTPRPDGPTFVPVTPCRLVDTRTTGGPIAPGAGRAIATTEAGACHIPEDALSVEATVTAVSPTGNGFLRAYPQGFSPPTATFLNYAKGEDATNTGSMALTPGPVGTKGLVVRTYGSATNVVVDVQGYYRRPQTAPEGSLFVAATPCRAFDSRASGTRKPLAAGERRDLTLVGQAGCDVPADAVAVEATVTAVDSPGSGFLRAWPSDRSAPNATFLTHTGGRSTTNTGTIAIRTGAGHPNLSVRNFGTASHVVVDIQGWFVPAPSVPAATFVSRIPCRVLDTRTTGGAVPAGGHRSVTVTNVPGCNVPDNAVAVEATITAVDPVGSGYLRVWPDGDDAPTATFLTYAKNRSTTNTGAISIRPGAGPNLELRNFAGPANFVIEIQGWYVPTD